MKSIIPIKIAAVILFGLLLAGPMEARSDKHLRYTRLSKVASEQSLSIKDHVMLHLPAFFVHPVEDWMFESDYLVEESAEPIESWMLDTEYLTEESQPVEGWMLDESYLGGDQ